MQEQLTVINRLIQQGQFQMAVTRLRGFLARQPGHAQARRYLGIALYKQEFYVEAINELKTALLYAPGDTEIQKTLQHVFQKYAAYAETFFKQKAYAEAVQCYKALLKLKPDNVAEIQGCLGRVLAKQRKYAEALVELDAALQQDPTLEWVKKILEQVQGILIQQGSDSRVAKQTLPAGILNTVKDLQSSWATALRDKTLSPESLARDACALEKRFYPCLSNSWRTPSLVSLLSCVLVNGFLSTHQTQSQLTGPLRELHFLLSTFIHQAEELLLRFGQRAYFIPWADEFLQRNPSFKRADHETQLYSLALSSAYWEDQACIDWLVTQGCPVSLAKRLSAMAVEQRCFAHYRQATLKKEPAERYRSLLSFGEHAWQQAQLLSAENPAMAVEYCLRSIIWLNAACAFAEKEKHQAATELRLASATENNWITLAIAHCRTQIRQVEVCLLNALRISRAGAIDWAEDDARRADLTELRQHIRQELEVLHQETAGHQKIEAMLSLSAYEDDASLHERASRLRHIAHRITNGMKGFIERLVNACVRTLGPPPCEYAFMGFGSLEKQSITPYSDFEFGIVVADESEPCIDYFRRLSCLLQAKVTNLGETPIPFSWFQYSFDDVTRMGFCFDLGGKTPLGRYYDSSDANVGKRYGTLKYDLIHTPQRMLAYVEDKHFATDKLLPVEIGRCTYITGSAQGENLIKEYHRLVAERFHQVDEKGQTFYAQRAIALLCGNQYLRADLETYQPQLGRLHEEKAFDVKKDLYRLPDRLIDSLAFFHGITVESAWEKLAEMQRQRIIAPEACRQLQILDGIATELRLRTYLHYNKQQERMVVVRKERKAIAEEIFHITDKGLVERFYYTVLPLYEAVRRFTDRWRAGQPVACLLTRETFYDDSLNTRIRILYRLGDYEAAEALLTRVAEHVNDDARVLEDLGHAHYKRGHYAEAEQCFAKALALVEREYGIQDQRIAGVLTSLAFAHGGLGNAAQARSLLGRALVIKRVCYGEQHVEFATTLVNLVKCRLEVGEPDLAQAKASLEQALVIIKKHYGEEHIMTARVLVNLALTQTHLHEKKASLEVVLRIAENHYGTDNVEIAKYLNNLANVYGALGNLAHKKLLLKRARRILEQHYGAGHIKVAKVLVNLANAYGATGDFERQRQLLEQALRIEQTHYHRDPQHIELAKTRYELARAFLKLKDPAAALRYLEQAYESHVKHYRKTHPDTQKVYSKLQQCRGRVPGFFPPPAAVAAAPTAAVPITASASSRGHTQFSARRVKK